MSLGRIMGVVLSFIVATLFIGSSYANKDIENNSFELIGDSGSATRDTVNYNDIALNQEKRSNIETIKYTNNQPYSIDLKASDISINCTGSNEEDNRLVEANMHVYALFANSSSNERKRSINIKSKETIYIYVVNEYVGDVYPTNEVSCNYRVDIRDC